MLKYIDKNGKKKPLIEYSNLCIEEVLDYGDKTLTCNVSMKCSVALEDIIRTRTNEYVIKQKNGLADDGTYTVTAKLNIDELEGTPFISFDTTEKTALEAAQLALAGTGWTCECDVKKKRTIRMTNASSWEILKKIVDTYMLEMQIDSINKVIRLKEKIGSYKGAYFTDQINLISLESQANTNDFYTRIYPIGKDGLTIESVNNGSTVLENHIYSSKNKTYIWKDERYTDPQSLKEDAAEKLADMAQPYIAYSCSILDLSQNSKKYKNYNIGDEVVLIDSFSKTKIKQRIKKISRYPDDPSKDTCEIANLKLTFTEMQQKLNDAADTVNNITTDNGTVDGSSIDDMDANKLTNVDDVVSKTESFKSIKTEVLTVTGELQSASGKIGELETNKLDAETARITYATIENLKSLSGEFEQFKTNDFTAITGKINDLTVGVEKVNTLMFGSASGGSLTTEFSNSVISLIGDAQIKSAMIESIDAKKIMSLDIDTTDVKVHSKDGKSQWTDNTIQISDSTRLRVQIGKDASGDYNMYVWDKAGNLMFDALGLTAKGIQREIIRNDMVSQDADISAEKLDIGSLFEVINKDGSHTLKSSKIYVDADNQTLDVSFKTITTKTNTAVEAANKAAESADNALSTANSADAKAQSVVIRADSGEFKGDKGDTGAKGDKGDTGATGNGVLSITPQYYLSTSNTTQSGGSWSNTRPSWVAGRYYWMRDYIQWTDGSVTASPPQLATDLNNLYSSLQTVTNTVSSQGTQLSTVQGQISSKVWQQDITTAVTNLQIGGRNLYKGTKYWNGEWIIKDGVTIAGDVAKMTAVAYPRYGTVAVKSKEQYTISIEIKSDTAHTTAEGGVILLDFVDSKNQRVVAKWVPGSFTTEWKRINYTFDVPESHNIVALWVGLRNNSNKVVYFRYLKLEKGNKATDWTPAPEDVDANISSVEGKITTVSNQYTTLNQSFTSLKATVNSNTTAISKKADNSTVTEINNRVTTLTADLSGIKQSISATYVTKTEYAKEIDRLGDNINNVDDKASAAQDWCQTIEDNITDHYSTTVQMNNAITQAVSAESNSIKLEVSGTYATKNDISNLQIGGRNLLTGSAGWTKANPAKSTNAADGYAYIGGKVYLENGKTYTLQAVSDSVWATGHGGQTGKATIWLHGLGDGFHRVFCGDGKTSGRYTWTFVHTSATQNCEIRINGYSKVTSFWDIKIESGNKATDWTPAQEDVNAKFNNYATTASLTAYIAKTDTGALKSCIEAIADTINLTAGGAINISGNKSVNISGNKFSLNSSGTKISSAGYLQTVNAKLGEWNVDSKAIYCVTTDKVYTAYLQNPDYVVGTARENAWVYSVQKNSYPTFYVTSEGELYTRKIKPCVNMEGLNVRVTSSASGIDIFWYTWNFRGTGLLLVNCAVWTDETDDYGTTSCAIYINDACVTANTHRYGENSNSVELDAGCSFAYWVRDSDIKLTIKAGSTKDGIKTFTRTIQTLFGLEQL